MARSVAVVGAGCAGAATASVLADVTDVTVFEREAAVGGRSCTREREGCRYEVGANYLTPTSGSVRALLEDTLPEETVLELDGEIRPFDGDGVVAGGGSDSEGSADDDHRLTCPEGIDGLAERLFEAADVDLVLDTRVDGLERSAGEWRVYDGADTDHGAFDAVVLTAPAPLSADVLGRSEWSHPDCRDVREAIASVPYRPITSVVLHYPYELDREWYALVNDDREHPLGWVAREDRKPGFVPDGESVLLVQCASDYTRDHYGVADDRLIEKVATLTAGLLEDDRLADPDWSDLHCWRYGVPEAGVDHDAIAPTSDHDLYVAGDWVVGEDRLNGALRSGLTTGEAIRDDLF